MSLYNDGYSNRAVALGMALPNNQAQAVYTQNGTNNLVATDTIQVGNHTWTFVTAIGTTPGNVLRGASWLITMQNLLAAIAASAAGGPATANYIPQATVPNYYAEFVGTNKVVFYSNTTGTAGNALASVYTASGTSAGSFGAANFAVQSGSSSRAVDWTVALGLSLQFEVAAVIVTPAVFEVWSDIPSVSNPCLPSGNVDNQQRIADDDLCNPLTGAAQPMIVTIPATAVVAGLNTQGFSQINNISAVGSFYQGRPRCLGAGSFIFVKAISGDTNNINVTALLSRLKFAN